MAAGVIIGRVAVKVIPDTSNFKDDLQRDLDRIEKSLDAVEIKIDVDTDTVVQEAKRARKKAQDQMKDLRLKVNLDSEESVKRGLQQLNREMERLGEVDIDVDLNEADLQAAMDLLNEQLEAVRTVKLSIDEANPADVRKAVDKINAQLQEIKRVELDIALNEQTLTETRNRLREKMDEAYREIRQNVQDQMKDILIGMDVDPIQAARTLRKIELLLEAIEDAKMTITPEMDERARFATLRKIQDMKDQVEDMKATIHPDLDSPKALALSARLALLARDRFVEYVPRMNKAAAAAVGMALARMSGARIIGGYMRDLYRSIIEFDKAIPKIIALSLAVAGLGASGIAATSNLFALSASLASIAPAALALPGILAGMVVGVGVLVAALKDFNKVFPDVQGALDKMQDSISANFWDGAKASMREMIDVLLPTLASGFDDVASRLGKFTARFTDAVTTQLAPALTPMFQSLAFSIDIAAGAADNIVGIITTLGTVGSSYLPGLARFFRDITEQFDAFLKRSTETGEIFQWIDAGVVALKDLARVGGNAALILYDIAQAAQAAGGSSLGSLANALGRIREITSSATFQKGLTEVFASAHEAMGNIATVSGPAVANLFKELGSLATDVLPVVGETIGRVVRGLATALTQPEVTNGIREMFDGIAFGVRKIEPAFEPLGRAFGTLGPLVGQLAANLGTVLGAAIPPVADALVRMGEAIEPLIPAIGELLLDAVNALTPVITNLSSAFVSIMEGGLLDLLVGSMSALGAAITAIPSEVLTGIVASFGIFAAVSSVLSISLGIASSVMGVWSTVAAVASVATRALAISFAALSLPMIAIIAAIALVIAAGVLLYKHWDTVKAFASKAWKAIKDEMSDSMKNAEKNIKAAWAAIKQEFQASWDNLKAKTKAGWEALKAEWDRATERVKTTATSAWEKLKSIWDQGVTAIKTKMAEAGAALKAEWERIKTQVSTSAQQAWDKAKAAFDTGVSNVKAAMARATAALKAEWERIKTQVSTSAQQAWSQAKSAFDTGVSNVVSVVQGLPGRITGALGNLGSLLTGAGRQVIDGFISGITGAFGRVRSTLSSLTSMLPDWKGPAERDKTILVNSGKLVMAGFLDGLESQYDSIKKSLKGLTDDLGGGLIEAPVMASVAQPMAQARQGLVGGVRTAVSESQSAAAGKTLIYHAAPGSSLGSEEDLFMAADRGRMVGW